ncbi:ethanolamine utilization microcompartment protein EutK [Salmonella enterica subsp. salamae]|nr:ethanolamine utilization microcompartment protein EutK [Salmonella enterica subsp. salamae]ECJ2281207.1 ethanolamine utilization microcompartment protein EutK [Salmonella enterica subsp. salamae]HCC0890565.1 ethanolamine utilization microcompartment protein EutK [Salmonella enterica]
MINALGLLEVEGMVAAMDAADAMLKAANVRLLNHEVLDPGRLTLVVEGDLAACRAALDAGSAAAQRTGRVISRKEIGRPEEDTQWLIGGFKREPQPPVQTPTPPAPETETPVASESVQELLALLASVRQGMTAGEVAAHFDWPLEQARSALEQLFSDGTLRKRSSRYRLKHN